MQAQCSPEVIRVTRNWAALLTLPGLRPIHWQLNCILPKWAHSASYNVCEKIRYFALKSDNFAENSVSLQLLCYSTNNMQLEFDSVR